MQNAAFAACGLDWAYLPLDVPPDRLEQAVCGLLALGFAGANVTIPHKTAVLTYCDELDEVAERSGSVNTLAVRDGRITGSSTDGLAVTGTVETAGERALLLGAGGAAQAVATALADAGVAELVICGRTPERAQALASRLLSVGVAADVRAEPWPPRAERFTLIVNATPIRDQALVEIHPQQQIVDLAYRSDGAATALVEAAQAAGCRRVVDGLELLVRQGAASFERWTGVEAPLAAMRAAVRGS